MLDLDNLPPRLRRADVPEYLRRKHGICLAVATLASWAVTGEGPRFQRDGRWPVYPLPDLDKWAPAIPRRPIDFRIGAKRWPGAVG